MTTGIVKAEVALNLPKQKAEVDITNWSLNNSRYWVETVFSAALDQ